MLFEYQPDPISPIRILCSLTPPAGNNPTIRFAARLPRQPAVCL